MAYKDLREYLGVLEARGKLFRVKNEVDRTWETSAITRRVFERIPEDKRPALYFERIKGSTMPMTVGVLGASREIYALALECAVEEIPDRWAEAQSAPIQPEVVRDGPCHEVVYEGDDIDVTQLPASTWTVEHDSGPYLTAPCVVSHDPETGERNVGTYRIEMRSPRRVGLQLSNATRDMWTHLHKNEQAGRNTPCSIVLGADPTVGLVAVSRVAYGLDEFSVASALRREPLALVKGLTNDIQVPAMSEIVLEGEVLCGEREPEGPFGEYTGYMSDAGPSYVIQVNALTHRRDPIFHDFLSQMPPSESSVIRGTGREVAIFKHLTRDLRLPVRDCHFLHPGGGAALLAISMTPKFKGQALQAAWGAWSVDPSLSKYTVVVDEDIDIRSEFEVLWAVCWRTEPQRDVQIVRETPPTPLDPSTSPPDMPRAQRRNMLSSKVLIDATRKHPFPPNAVPPREHLRRVDERWADYGFTAL